MIHDKTGGKTDNRYLKALVVFSVFLVSFFAVSSFLNSTDRRSSLDTRTYAAGEAAPSWMWPLTWLFPSEQKPARSLKLSSFAIPTPSITPIGGQSTPSLSTPVPTIPGGGPPVSTAQYCVDDEPTTVLIEACDDETRCDIAHGDGGPSGTCGRVIGWTHPIIESLLTNTGTQYDRRLTDNFVTAITSFCHTAAPWQPYISTFIVIDSYRLAGFSGFDRGTHADAAVLTNAWKSTAGYTTSTSVQGVTPGDAIFFGNPSHVGIVNTVEVDTNGNGSMWFLHTGASYYLGKLFVANWAIVESSTGDTAVIFGSNASKGADTTTGSTMCYCDGGTTCYEWHFTP